jgi:hypothetical protein
MYLQSGPSDNTRIILEMMKTQKAIFDALGPGTRDGSGYVEVVKNAAQVVGVGAGVNLLGVLWRPALMLGLQWYFGGF